MSSFGTNTVINARPLWEVEDCSQACNLFREKMNSSRGHCITLYCTSLQEELALHLLCMQDRLIVFHLPQPVSSLPPPIPPTTSSLLPISPTMSLTTPTISRKRFLVLYPRNQKTRNIFEQCFPTAISNIVQEYLLVDELLVESIRQSVITSLQRPLKSIKCERMNTHSLLQTKKVGRVRVGGQYRPPPALARAIVSIPSKKSLKIAFEKLMFK